MFYGLGAAAFILPVAGCFHRGALKALSEPQVLMRLCDARTIQRMGEAYRNQVPSESEKEALSDRLLVSSSGNTLTEKEKTDNSAIHAFLNKKILLDFEAGRIVTLRGWMLSQTEARQCAMFSLLSY